MGLEGNKQYLVRERVSRLCFWSPGVLNTLLGSGRKTFIRENNEGSKLRSSGGARRWTKAQVVEFYLGRSQDPSFSKPGGRRGRSYKWRQVHRYGFGLQVSYISKLNSLFELGCMVFC